MRERFCKTWLKSVLRRRTEAREAALRELGGSHLRERAEVLKGEAYAFERMLRDASSQKLKVTKAWARDWLQVSADAVEARNVYPKLDRGNGYAQTFGRDSQFARDYGEWNAYRDLLDEID